LSYEGISPGWLAVYQDIVLRMKSNPLDEMPAYKIVHRGTCITLDVANGHWTVGVDGVRVCNHQEEDKLLGSIRALSGQAHIADDAAVVPAELPNAIETAAKQLADIAMDKRRRNEFVNARLMAAIEKDRCADAHAIMRQAHADFDDSSRHGIQKHFAQVLREQVNALSKRPRLFDAEDRA
jgi:hypothetical protein